MKHLLAFLLAFALGYLIATEPFATTVNASVPPPPPPQQENPDVYPVAGWPSVFAGWTPGDLSTFNPLTVKLRNGVRTITYSYIVVPGCSDGNMFDTLQVALSRTTDVTGITFVRVSTGADATLRATCGTDAANMGVTGAVVGDVYPGWPYTCQVNINTIMATYAFVTQESIWLHEFAGGHCLASADEQYRKDGTFASTALNSFMNVGPLSRVVWPQADIDRWSRVVFDIEPAPVTCPCWDGALWHFDTGWTWNPANDVWTDSLGRVQYEGCNKDHLRYSPTQGRWKQPLQPDGFDPALNQWITVPGC